jgi:uncharacterized protein YgiB involved in biofilm formation
MKGRRSSRVELVMLGTVLIGGCSNDDVPKDRYVYKAKQECVQDWGETNCESSPARTGGSFAAGALAGAYFFGPRFGTVVQTPDNHYMWSGTKDYPAVDPRSGRAMGSKAVNVSTRGGFGRSASAIHSSGS